MCYANSVLGARTNREGGPSALAAALTGRTPAYGYHLDENRQPGSTVEVTAQRARRHDQFGALGKAIGEQIWQAQANQRAVYHAGSNSASAGELEILLRQPGHLRRGGAVPHAGHHARSGGCTAAARRR